MTRAASSPYGVHRVLEPSGGDVTLPQGALRLDTTPQIWPDEVRIGVETLNLDAASYRQLAEAHQRPGGGTDGAAVRAAVLQIVARRGKMQNPVTGSGGMLVGTVQEVGADSPLGLHVGDHIATLVSLTLTPLHLTDGLSRWDGLSERVPAAGHAILFGRSIAAVLPSDLPTALTLMVMDVCGAPALVARFVREYAARSPARPPRVLVLGGAGKSGSLSLAAAADAGAGRRVGVVPDQWEAAVLRDAVLVGGAPLADEVVVADARSPLGLAAALSRTVSGTLSGTPSGVPVGTVERSVSGASPEDDGREDGRDDGRADITVVCVDVPGCEQPAVMATRDGGTVLFFSMATSFPAAALGAEGLAADVRLVIGNGYVPGHAAYALDLVRRHAGVRGLFERRLASEHTGAS